MYAVVITEKGGEQRRLDFDKNEVTIGRVQGNDVILPKGNVSKRHSRIVVKDGKFIIVDLKSTNGTYVNGRKITSPLVIKASDRVYIGDFIIHIDDGTTGAEAAPVGAPPPPPAAAASARPVPPSQPPPRRAAPSEEAPPQPPPRSHPAAPPERPAYMDEDDGLDPLGQQPPPAAAPPPRRATGPQPPAAQPPAAYAE
ncbi:MAG: FHA domain-containing protein, partial [bacterium]